MDSDDKWFFGFIICITLFFVSLIGIAMCDSYINVYGYGKQKYTGEIIIKDTYSPNSGMYNIIVSTDNMTYLTRSYDIFKFAKNSIGKRVVIEYIEVENDKCQITSIDFALDPNTIPCNVHLCGIPVK